MKREDLKTKTDLLIDEIPEESSWAELMCRIYVRQKIERGIRDADAGKDYSSGEVRHWQRADGMLVPSTRQGERRGRD